ncbi:unnamed protein product [Sphagnum tenellum]
MTGRHAGVVTLLENECSNPMLHIWCILHELDILVKNATHGVLDEAFYKVAHTFSPLFEWIAVTFATFQSPNLAISHQRQELSNLMADIAAGLDIRSTVDVALINEINPTTIIQRDGWIVTKDVVIMHIRD